MARQILREGFTVFVLAAAFVLLAATVGTPRLRPRDGLAQAAVSFEESLLPAGLARPSERSPSDISPPRRGR